MRIITLAGNLEGRHFIGSAGEQANREDEVSFKSGELYSTGYVECGSWFVYDRKYLGWF